MVSLLVHGRAFRLSLSYYSLPIEECAPASLLDGELKNNIISIVSPLAGHDIDYIFPLFVRFFSRPLRRDGLKWRPPEALLRNDLLLGLYYYRLIIMLTHSHSYFQFSVSPRLVSRI